METNIDQKLLELKSLCERTDKGIEVIRINFVIMKLLGVKEQEISNIFGFCDRTIDELWMRYYQYSVDGIKDLDRNGCPKKLTDAREKQFVFQNHNVCMIL